MKKAVNERKKNDVIVFETSKQTTLYQPNAVTLMRHHYNLLQMRAFITIIASLQREIKTRINKNRLDFNQMQLFKEFNDFISVKIPLSNFHEDYRHYYDLRKSLEEMAKVIVKLETIDEKTGQKYWETGSLFWLKFPKIDSGNNTTKKYNNDVFININKNVAKILIGNDDNGYTQYIEETAKKLKTPYSIRLYMLISSWKDKGAFKISIENFKKWLDIEDKYADFKDLNKRVIKPAHDELKEIKANCRFEVAQDKSNPEILNFKVIREKLTKAEELRVEASVKAINLMLQNVGVLSEKEIKDICKRININNATSITQKIISILTYSKKNKDKISNISSYVHAGIITEIEKINNETVVLE